MSAVRHDVWSSTMCDRRHQWTDELFKTVHQRPLEEGSLRSPQRVSVVVSLI